MKPLYIGKQSAIACGLLFTCLSLNAVSLKVQGSTTVNPVVTEALETLALKEGLKYTIDTLGGSTGGIHAIGNKSVDIGMASRRIKDSDRQRFPDIDFYETIIGADGVALVVPPDVWKSGVKTISREQMQKIYEKEIKSWSSLNGPSKRIVFFNKEPGRGTWSVFADWLYGKSSLAPQVSHPEVGANAEVRNKVSRTRGALSQLSVSWVDNKTLFALGIINKEGTIVWPSTETVINGSYPMSRPLVLITDGPPLASAKKLIDSLLSHEGQALVKKHGFVGIQKN